MMPSALNYRFKRALDNADPRKTIVDFWPAPPTSLIRYAQQRGFITVREMINTYSGTAKAILDEAYERSGLGRKHNYITDEMVESECEELKLYDFVLSASPRIESSLLEAGVDSTKLLHSTFGWAPAELVDIGKKRENSPGFRLLFIGGDSVRKGVPQLLEAWAKSGVAGELLIVGNISPVLKPLVAPYLQRPDVRLEGFLLDLGHFYRSADTLVIPSLEEGDPQVTYQAAGYGLPLIATPMGGGNILRDGINGLMVQPYDVDGLAAAITRLANSPELRKRLGARAAIDARSYTYERVGLERARILRGLLDARFGGKALSVRAR
jgi:glycosyltransferase involved in cell wall biosynthesis